MKTEQQAVPEELAVPSGDIPPLVEVDPDWAWSPYSGRRPKSSPEDRAGLPWNLASVAHLYRRAGFGANWAELRGALEAGPEAAVGRLIEGGPSTSDFDRQFDQMVQPLLGGGDPQNLSAWWLYGITFTPFPLREKMTLFWHGHFATSAAKVRNARLMYRQSQLLRQHALGSFRELLLGISRDPAMLLWLDSATNRKLKPNENYARELMELFALGIGSYMESDIQQAARAFTGWEVRNEQFRFNHYEHDDGEKTVLGQSGRWNGDDVVRIVLDQPVAARFIAEKLFRFFVSETEPPPHRLLKPLADGFRSRDYDIAWLVETLLRSNLFFSAYAWHQKIKSPVEYAVGLVRALELKPNMYRLAQMLDEMGQRLFYPPNVKGWDGGTQWINSSALLARANLVQELISSDTGPLSGPNPLVRLIQKQGLSQPVEVVDWVWKLLVSAPVPETVREELLEIMPTDAAGAPSAEALVRLVHAIGTLPEYQLG